MEKNKKILLGGIIVAIVAGAILFCYFFGKSYWSTEELSYTKLCVSPMGDCIEPVYTPLPPPPIPLVATSTPMSEWKTFVNTKYGYSVLVPQTAEIGPTSGHGSSVPTEEESELTFYAERAVLNGILNIQIFGHRGVSQWMGREGIFDLKAFSEVIRNAQVNNDNPFVLNKKVGELMEIQFADTNAYGFILNGVFVAPNRSYEYILDPKVPHLYIITENLRGHKVIIHHPLNDISEKMVKTIRFIK